MSSPEETGSPGRLRQWVSGSQSVKERLQGVVPRLKAGARLLRRHLRPSGASALAERLNEIDEEFVEEGARSITDTDVETVVQEAEAIEERFRDNGPLRRLFEDGRLLLGLVQDVRWGRYRSVPIWTLSAAVFTLLYVLNPLDLIPDALPLLGVLDDAAVVSACLALLEQDLYDYREWRRQGTEEAAEANNSLSEAEAEKLTSG